MTEGKYAVGIDSGSTTCKGVLFVDGEAVEVYRTDTSWDPERSAEEVLETLLRRRSLRRGEVLIAATGYGREAISMADFRLTEITCHAYGGIHLVPNIQGIVDIGGQDSKIIRIADGRVDDFLMNDKCSAGTGRFLTMACDKLGIPIEELDDYADPAKFIPINSMCTVFAESEIISLLSMKKERREILSGVLRSIGQKVRQMSGKFSFGDESPILMTGGLSCSEVLISTIAEMTGLPLITHPYAVYAGAIGACVAGEKKRKKA